MTVVNPKSISGITSITTASGSDNLLTIHTSDANNTERLRIDSTSTTKIVTGIVTTLTVTGSAKVGSGVTLSPDGDIFITGVSTSSLLTSLGQSHLMGSVGIGTTIPGARVHIVHDNPTVLITDKNQAADNKTWRIHAGDSQKLLISALNDAGAGAGRYFNFLRSDNNVEQFIGNNGANPWFTINNQTRRVGIGTSIPAADLHVSSGANTEIRIGDITTTPSYGRIIYNNNADSADALVIEADGGNAISGSNIRFKIDGGEKARILSTGGITFNGDTAAANAVDDYEEGDYLPSFTLTSGSITLADTHKTLCYTKIGRQVTIIGQLKIESVSSPSGIMRASLPFARGSQTEQAERTMGNIMVTNAAVNNANEFTTYPDGGSDSYLEIISISGTTINRNGGQNMQAGAYIYVNYTYFAAT